ncbi:hypothetical protein [Jannaschia sp. R86511]|uniref:hypothetical protein n=1 Tax=Jannaschia sp. R86511 TaxID=3093853 RepID=UPI0036D3A848
MTAPSRPTSPGTRRSSPRLVRAWVRVLHLAVGAALATYVYLPSSLAAADVLRVLLAVVGVPLVVVTGLLLWKQAQARRLLARLRARGRVLAAPAPVATGR